MEVVIRSRTIWLAEVMTLLISAMPIMISCRRVRGQSKQWLTESFSHRKSVVLQVNSRPYGQSDPDFLIRDSAQFGARRCAGGKHRVRGENPARGTLMGR